MTVGGLVGGANVIDLIISKFYSFAGKEHQLHLSRYAGKSTEIFRQNPQL